MGESGRYLHKYLTRAAHDAAHTRSNESEYIEPWVAYTMETREVSYNIPPHNYAEDYLTFEALESGTFTLTIPKRVDESYLTSVSYSLDNGETWTTTSNAYSDITITTTTVQVGDTVLWKGIGTSYYYSITYYCHFSSTCDFAISGNIMSLIYGDEFRINNTLTGTHTFYKLFVDNTYLTESANLVLPATTLAPSCYSHMFYGCTALTTAPTVLPAETLAAACYTNMFNGCTSLTTTPALPATTLAQDCYKEMFYHCTSLTSAPTLPATTMEQDCYYHMFAGCTGLTTCPVLPAETLAQGCYCLMFVDCTGLTTGPTLPAESLARACYQQMFMGCTSLTTAPVLSATTLAYMCYYGMFRDCTSLTTAPELPATALASYCYVHMFYGCTSLTTAPALPATTLASNCYNQMFYGCTSLTAAPVLPATTLVSGCYNSMFNGCTSLNYIKAMFTTAPSDTYTQNWVNGVSATGTFVKNNAALWYTEGTNAIPSGWTVQNASE